MAGFLVARGARFTGTEIAPNGDVVFSFQDDQDQATEILNEYPGSPEQRYDSAVKTMHDFVKMAQRRKRGRRG